MMSAVFGLAGFAAISFFQFMYPFICKQKQLH